MSYDITPYVYNESNNTYELPPNCNNDWERYTVNLSNYNAFYELDKLGYPDAHSSDEVIPIDEFIQRIEEAAKKEPRKNEPLPDYRYSHGRILELQMLIAEAKALGATHVGWG